MTARNTRSIKSSQFGVGSERFALMKAHSAPAAPGREWWERPVTEGSVAAAPGNVPLALGTRPANAAGKQTFRRPAFSSYVDAECLVEHDPREPQKSPPTEAALLRWLQAR